MVAKFLKFITKTTRRRQEPAATILPKGFEAAPPIKNEQLLKWLEGDDITTSGGVHLVADGQPLLKRQAVNH